MLVDKDTAVRSNINVPAYLLQKAHDYDHNFTACKLIGIENGSYQRYVCKQLTYRVTSSNNLQGSAA